MSGPEYRQAGGKDSRERKAPTMTAAPPTHDPERIALIAEVGRYCPCGIDLYRNGCYRCLKARGAVWYYDPHATCAQCGAPIPLNGHACTVRP